MDDHGRLKPKGTSEWHPFQKAHRFSWFLETVDYLVGDRSCLHGATSFDELEANSAALSALAIKLRSLCFTSKYNELEDQAPELILCLSDLLDRWGFPAHPTKQVRWVRPMTSFATFSDAPSAESALFTDYDPLTGFSNLSFVGNEHWDPECIVADRHYRQAEVVTHDGWNNGCLLHSRVGTGWVATVDVVASKIVCEWPSEIEKTKYSRWGMPAIATLGEQPSTFLACLNQVSGKRELRLVDVRQKSIFGGRAVASLGKHTVKIMSVAGCQNTHGAIVLHSNGELRRFDMRQTTTTTKKADVPKPVPISGTEHKFTRTPRFNHMVVDGNHVFISGPGGAYGIDLQAETPGWKCIEGASTVAPLPSSHGQYAAIVDHSRAVRRGVLDSKKSIGNGEALLLSRPCMAAKTVSMSAFIGYTKQDHKGILSLQTVPHA